MLISSANNGGYPTGYRRSSGKSGGFTLVEMVLALAILGLLASLGLPFSRPNAGMAAARSKAFQIVALLREDRNKALRSGSTATVSVDAQAGFLHSTISGVTIFVPPPMSLGVAMNSIQGVQFYADGKSSGGSLALGSGRRGILITINRMTSAISVSDVER